MRKGKEIAKQAYSAEANLAAAVQADADGGQADGAGAGVHEHLVAPLEAAAHD